MSMRVLHAGEIFFSQDRIVNRLGPRGDQAENLHGYKTSLRGQTSGLYLDCPRFDAKISFDSALSARYKKKMHDCTPISAHPLKTLVYIFKQSLHILFFTYNSLS